jgi:hypothetical protein
MSRLVPQSSKGFPAAREACSRSTNIPARIWRAADACCAIFSMRPQGSSIEMAGTKNLEFTCTCAVATITS